MMTGVGQRSGDFMRELINHREDPLRLPARVD